MREFLYVKSDVHDNARIEKVCGTETGKVGEVRGVKRGYIVQVEMKDVCDVCTGSRMIELQGGRTGSESDGGVICEDGRKRNVRRDTYCENTSGAWIRVQRKSMDMGYESGPAEMKNTRIVEIKFATEGLRRRAPPRVICFTST